MRAFKHEMNGEHVCVPRALPIFRNLPKCLTKALPKERKRRKSMTESAVPDKRRSVNHDTAEANDVVISEQSIMLTEQLHSLSAVIRRPSGLWSMQTFEQTNALSYQTAKLDRDATPPVVHNKIVFFEIEVGAAAQCSISLNGLLFEKK